MLKWNLRLRIFVYFAISAILPSLLFWIFMYAKIDEKFEQDYLSMTYVSIQHHIKEVDQFLEKQAYVVNSIAKAYPYIDNSDHSILEFLKIQAETSKDFQNLYIVDNKGRAYVNSGEILDNINYAALTPYKYATRQKQLVWLEPYNDRISGLRTIGIAVPIYNLENQQEGVLVANLPYGYFNNALSDTNLPSNTDVYLIDSYGDIKFTNTTKAAAVGDIKQKGIVPQKAAEHILSLDQGTDDFEYNGEKWIYSFYTIRTMNWKIVVLYRAQHILENVSIINQDVYSFITIIGAAVLISVLLLSIYLSNSISKPLLKLKDGVEQVALGNLDHTVTLKGMEEIKVVADTFNLMSYNLKKSYEDLFKKTEELSKKNKHLQIINAELEASYQQLGAAMEQLNESEDKYRRLVNNISDLVAVINTNKEIVYVNNSVERIVGYPESQLIGKNLTEFLKEKVTKETLEECFNNDFFEFQIEMTRADGGVLFMEGSTRRLIENGRVAGIQAVARDITQRKLMEDELKKRYKELQAINEITNAVTSTLDLDEVLDIVAEQVMHATGGLACIVGLYDENKDYIIKSIKEFGLEDKRAINVDSIKTEIMRLVGKNKYYIVEHHSEEGLPSEFFKMLYREEGYRYTLINSLIAHDKLIGIMITLHKNKPSQEMIELSISMGNSIALSIDNAKVYEKVKTSYRKTVQSLISTIEAKDIYTESHSIRVAKYASFIAKEMNMSKNDIENIWVAGVLHDIGKIGISDSILHKKEVLTEEEYAIIKEHPVIAYKILSNIGLDENVMNAIRHHHERYDGKGYPDGLQGEDISLMASIISVADAFDAITSNRSYKQAKTLQEGIEELIACKGKQFNPMVVDVFSRSFNSKREIFHKIHSDEKLEVF